jgi:class 3 adenylate cyclase
VGINIGDVIVEPHDIFGDGVNIAARLESIAEPGGICISSSAYDHVRGKVGLSSLILASKTSKTSLARFVPTLSSGMDLARRHRPRARDRACFHRLISPSLCCLSPTSAAIPSKITSSMV